MKDKHEIPEKDTDGISRENISENYVRMYYEHQYDRFDKLESANFSLTNIVVTISVVAFTFGFKDIDSTTINVVNGLGLPCVIILANLFAIGYSRRGYRYMLAHKARAKEMLRIYAPALKKYDENNPIAIAHEWGDRRNYETLLHSLLIIISFIPPIVFFW